MSTSDNWPLYKVARKIVRQADAAVVDIIFEAVDYIGYDNACAIWDTWDDVHIPALKAAFTVEAWPGTYGGAA